MQNPKRRALKHIFCLLLHGYVDKIKNSKKSKMILKKKFKIQSLKHTAHEDRSSTFF